MELVSGSALSSLVLFSVLVDQELFFPWYSPKPLFLSFISTPPLLCSFSFSLEVPEPALTRQRKEKEKMKENEKGEPNHQKNTTKIRKKTKTKTKIKTVGKHWGKGKPVKKQTQMIPNFGPTRDGRKRKEKKKRK